MLLEALDADMQASSSEEYSDDDALNHTIPKMNFCPSLLHLDPKVNDDGAYSIVHLITHERLVLPEGKDYEMRFIDKQFWLVSTCKAYKRPVYSLFKRQLKLNDETFFIDVLDGAIRTPVQPDQLACLPRYLAQDVSGKQMRIKIYHTPWSKPGFWFELRRFHFLFGISCEAASRFVTTNWYNWQTWVSQYCPYYMALRPAFDPRGSVEQHYLRCTDQASASPAGMLILAGRRCMTARPSDIRPTIAQALDEFLHPLMKDHCFELVVTEGEQHVLAMNSSPASGEIELCLDNGLVDMGPLLSESYRYRELVKQAIDTVGSITGTVSRISSAASFLIVIMATGNDVLISEIIAQYGLIIEHVLPSLLKSNPLDIVEEVQCVGTKARADKMVTDKLILGLGGGSDQKPVEFSGQHVRSWQMLTEEGKRMRVLDPGTMNLDIMRRVHQVTEVTFGNAWSCAFGLIYVSNICVLIFWS